MTQSRVVLSVPCTVLGGSDNLLRRMNEGCVPSVEVEVFYYLAGERGAAERGYYLKAEPILRGPGRRYSAAMATALRFLERTNRFDKRAFERLCKPSTLWLEAVKQAVNLAAYSNVLGGAWAYDPAKVAGKES